MNRSRPLTLHVNGVERTVAAEPHAILLDVLREGLHLTGTKRGCDMGTCGCCTVQIDGEARLGCLTLAHAAAGHRITTIEALGTPSDLHPLQRAFSELGGSQCGFCTPGFIMTAKALLERNPRPTRPEIKQAISGNLCRCTGYVKIVDAIASVSQPPSGGASVATAATVPGGKRS